MSPTFVYSRIPKIACKQRCQASCGPILASEQEILEIRKATGRELPDPLAILKSRDCTCTLLTPAGTCSIYLNRPLICRLWGVVRRMACPLGCIPERWLSDEEAHELMALLEENE